MPDHTMQSLPLIGQGTWNIEKDPADRAAAALRRGIELGMTLIDTAEMYGNGAAEKITGRAITGQRDKVFVVSKVLPTNASFDGTRRACERSLERLGIDCLDLYLLHWRGGVPLSETMRGLESLVRDGMTRSIGVSNFDVEDLREAERCLKNEPLACNQVLYHLGDRGIERRLMPYCRERGIAVMGYSPFGHSGFRGRPELKQVADRNGKTVRQLVLAFLIRDGVFAIPKSGNPSHVEENAGALGVRLSEQDVVEIDKAFPAPDRDVPLGMI